VINISAERDNGSVVLNRGKDAQEKTGFFGLPQNDRDFSNVIVYKI